jgi:ATP-dependent RNA helicase DDX3X
MSGGDGNEDPDHSFMMFSATFPKEFRKLARKYMEEDYYRISVGRIGSTHENIKQEIIWADESRKRDALYDKLFSIPPARTMVFVNSKRQADLLDDFLFNKGLPSTSIHADRTQREREDAM